MVFLVTKPVRLWHVASRTRRLKRATLGTPEAPITLVCIVRNGAHYIAPFLTHYRRLGVTHFVMIDNGSSDNTQQQLLAQDDVSLFSSQASFGQAQVEMREWVIWRYARQGWCLQVDIDEFLDFPSARSQRLPGLIAYLEQQGHTAMTAYMLDFFPRQAIAQIQASEDWLSHQVYYDPSGIVQRPNVFAKWHGNRLADPKLPCWYQGIRCDRLQLRNVMLTKVPLFRLGGGVLPLLTNSHAVFLARISDVCGILKHHRFEPGFLRRAESDARQHSLSCYQSYLDALGDDPDLSLYSDNSVRYQGPEALETHGIYHVRDSWHQHCAQRPAPTEALPDGLTTPALP